MTKQSRLRPQFDTFYCVSLFIDCELFICFVCRLVISMLTDDFQDCSDVHSDCNLHDISDCYRDMYINI